MSAPSASERHLPDYLWRAFTSTLGAKILMAVSGFLLYGFLVAHLAGNLLMYAGPAEMNGYAHFLKSTPELLWPLRIGLIAAFILHVLSAVRLVGLSAAARPQHYQVKKWRKASLASRTMFWVSGLLVFVFIFFHLFHFTFGLILPQYFSGLDANQHPDVFAMVVQGFRLPWVVVLYTLCMGGLGLHLSHGVWSSTQTIGLNGPRWTPFMKVFSKVFAIVMVVAFLSIPWVILLGGIQLP